MKIMNRTGKKSAFFKALGIIAATSILVSGCGGATRSKVQPQSLDEISKTSFDWKQYSGTTVNVMLVDHPWTNGFKATLADFMKETGIKVNLDVVSEDLYFDKLAAGFRNANGPDVFMTGLDSTIVNQHREGVIESLTPFINNPKITASDYNLADFPKEVLDPAELPALNGKKELFGIPISTECYILFYNQHLVDKYLGGVVPTTMADLISDAQLITQAGKGEVFGSVVRGLANADIDILTSLVYNQWSSTAGKISLPYNVWFKDSWSSPRMTDPAVVKGLSDYAALMAAGPPNRLVSTGSSQMIYLSKAKWPSTLMRVSSSQDLRIALLHRWPAKWVMRSFQQEHSVGEQASGVGVSESQAPASKKRQPGY